uniref:Uncharacterized protein n=1 Tax=candidate division CPR3 bacterium TaxID=2268181 RepID=A0A7V3JA04_UNCC3
MAKKPTKRQQKAISEDVSKLVRGYEKTGKITTSRATYHPKNKKEAIKQALAVEYGKRGIGRAGRRSKK